MEVGGGGGRKTQAESKTSETLCIIQRRLQCCRQPLGLTRIGLQATYLFRETVHLSRVRSYFSVAHIASLVSRD